MSDMFHDHERSNRIATLLRLLFVSKPLARDIDAEAAVAAYSLALRCADLDDLTAVVEDIVTGHLLGDDKFCPRPPELAKMVRNRREAKALMARPAPALRMPERGGPAPFDVAIERAKVRFTGRDVLATFSSHDEAMALARTQKFPPGTVFSCMLGKVFGPEVAP